ncbi:MAG: hypothetical protein E7576_13500 [Ruminococcaceae bacterium]|jgi:type II secretory pathway pseudopilin PulG|nr:hypothetical protein [Oscillospiraceae bacterium]
MKKHITSFYVETLILILVFVAVILTLTQVFGMAKKQSEEAKLLTSAVTLAQNAAEAFSAADSAESLFTLLDEGGNAALEGEIVTAAYGADGKPDPNGVLRVEIKRVSDSRWLAIGYIRVLRTDSGDEIYSLKMTAHFLEDFGK